MRTYGLTNEPSIIIADNNYETSGGAVIPVRMQAESLRLLLRPVSCGEFQGEFMVDGNKAGRLLSFPAPTAAPGSPAEDWSLRILETKDKLLDALEFLRVAYNEMLAGKAVSAADQVLANVEAILRNDEEIPDYTVVAAIRIHRPLSPDAKQKVLLLFPTACESCLAVEPTFRGNQ
jgi:hypothetical protein